MTLSICTSCQRAHCPTSDSTCQDLAFCLHRTPSNPIMRASFHGRTCSAELFFDHASSRWLFLLLGLKVHDLCCVSTLYHKGSFLVVLSHEGRRLDINTRMGSTYIKPLLITRSLNLRNLLLRPLTVQLSAFPSFLSSPVFQLTAIRPVPPPITRQTHISLSINSNLPLTAITASCLSCFNKTGPTCL